jgi:hypothetical protein
MEPERNIEKLLRAFAKKRRGDAAKLPGLHPVTRRKLHAEVEKHFAEPEEADSISLWQLFRQRWAVLLGFALVIFFIATILLPALSNSKKRPLGSLAKQGLKLGAPAEAKPEAGLFLTDKSPVATNRWETADFVAGSAPTAAASTATSQAAPALVPAAPAPVAVKINDRKPLSYAASEPDDSAIKSGNPWAVPEQKAHFKSAIAASPSPSSASNNSQRFVQAANTAPTPPVLESFEVRQNGNILAIVDRDGSVYNGSITLEPSGAQVQYTLAVTGATTAEQGQKEVARNIASAQAQGSLGFSVTGQNRTLMQNVVFNGNLIPMPGANALNANSNQQAAWLLNNSRITGTATMDATNQVKIDAVPASP